MKKLIFILKIFGLIIFIPLDIVYMKIYPVMIVVNIAIAFMIYISVIFRLTIFNFFSVIKNAVIDLYLYFRYYQFRICSTGKLVCFVGLFGKGKTLSAVHEVIDIYKKYNNVVIYDLIRKEWLVQYVDIISNVTLNVPYTEFISLEQIVDAAEINRVQDLNNHTRTVTIVLGDEFSVQLNSRNFKSNINPQFLNTILTCRHHNISLYYTAQRFNHVDALLRQVTSYVVDCNKIWRYQVHKYYDAFELENAVNVTIIQPFKRTGFFVRNSDYNAYDTLACVGNLKKSWQEKDMLSEQEILELQRGDRDIESVDKLTRKYRRMKRKM